MSKTPHHNSTSMMAGKDTAGCGFIGAIFGPKHHHPKTPPLPRLEASKEHPRRQIHTSKRPPRTTTTKTQVLYTRGFSKHPPPPTAVKKPVPLNAKPVVKAHMSTAAFYGVSQVTNIAYTKQLRKEPSFTSSDLSLRISVLKTPNSGGSTAYRPPSSTHNIPGHLGNVMKKNNPDRNNVGNIIYRKEANAELFKNMGNDKYKQGRFVEAIKLYTEAIAMDSKVASYYSNRSAALIGLRNYIDAILDCKIAIRIDPSYHRAHYRLASLYIRFGETEKALCHYKCSGGKAENRDIANVQVIRAQLGSCFKVQKTNDWRKLLKETQVAFSLGADSSLQVYAMQIEALLNLHRHDEAYSTFQNAPAIDMDIASMLFGPTVTSSFLTVKAQVYLASGRIEDAVSVAMQASELDPREEVFSVVRKTQALAKARENGNKYFKVSQLYEACKVYGEGLEHEAYNSVLLCNRAACHYKLGQFERAIEDCTLALHLRPSYGKARLRRAQCNAKLERWEAAMEDYNVLNHERQGDEAVEREYLEVLMQLKGQSSIVTVKTVVSGSNT